MSYGASAVVFHHSKATGTDLHVLNAIANFIGDDGAWPSVETIAKFARTSSRQVHRSLNVLVELGEITILSKSGKGVGVYKTNRYLLTLSCPEDCAGDWNHTNKQFVRSRGDTQSGLEVTHTADKPVIEPVNESVRKKFSSDWLPSARLKESLQENYPNADLEQHLKEMIDYLLATGKDKQVKDMAARFRLWMANADKYAKGALSKQAFSEYKEWK